jgi:hypothetical protein
MGMKITKLQILKNNVAEAKAAESIADEKWSDAYNIVEDALIKLEDYLEENPDEHSN